MTLRTGSLLARALCFLGVLLGAAGCPWNGFSDWEQRAPVQVIDTPDDFGATQFGTPLRVLTHPAFPRTLVVGGRDTDVLGVVRLNDHGNLDALQVARVAAGDLAGTGDRQNDLVRALALLDEDAEGNPRVLAGVPEHNYVRLVTLPTDGPPQADPTRIHPADAGAPPIATSGFGGALLAADLDANPVDDWVIAAQEYTLVVFNGVLGDATALSAQSLDPAPPADGQLAAGRFFEADDPAMQAVVRGEPSAGTAPGAVTLYRPGPGGLAGNAVPIYPPAPFAEPGFGYCLAAADVNHDGVSDLAVGIPSEPGRGSVALYLSEGPAGDRALPSQPTLLLETGEADPRRFGQRVAWIDLDGDHRPELVVADPEAPYGPASRGRLHIFGGDFEAGGALTEVVLGDGSEQHQVAGVDLWEPTESLGLSLAALHWGTAGWDGQELVAGSPGRILIFFRTTWPGDQDEGADPR